MPSLKFCAPVSSWMESFNLNPRIYPPPVHGEVIFSGRVVFRFLGFASLQRLRPGSGVGRARVPVNYHESGVETSENTELSCRRDTCTLDRSPKNSQFYALQVRVDPYPRVEELLHGCDVVEG